ncbi:hypothetical protein OIV83_000646 [Microbotryomycetes sp. JL201]|nr:hypothetical protein OIV83_000646 [Microbotryomycetes sp. JL201]
MEPAQSERNQEAHAQPLQAPSRAPTTSSNGGGTGAAPKHEHGSSRDSKDEDKGRRGDDNPEQEKRHRHLIDIAPPYIAHFLGRRPALSSPLLPGFKHVPEQVESALLAFIGAFVGILLACAVSYGLSEDFNSLPIAFGSLGATSVLLFIVPNSPLSQPRNVICGHLLSAVSGVCITYLFSLSPKYSTEEAASRDEWRNLLPVAAALSVALASFLMQLTGTVHPPGGATALLAASRRTYAFVLLVFLSVTVMCAWACIINNLGRKKYPVYWWTPETINIRIDPLINFGRRSRHDNAEKPTDVEKGRTSA